ncbi:mucin-5AC-like isoform X2 [Orbicella faveolata]|uniref:mucin-5AC-like isoform X2 n=1 Tax=Orbicella faveolata TaxID=48498 RepID=UPI0009E43122|nr:mucin-5AC-like isoform X2 [Orbicella faveolata]
MARIHLFMCSFLVSLVLSSSTTTVHPSLSVSSVVKASSSTPTSVQPSPSASATVIDPNSIQATPSSSANVTHSTSVAPGASTTKKFQARMTVNETYKAGFNDSSSTDFKIFAYNFSRSVGGFLNTELDGFERVVVKGLANGSVVVDFDIVVQKSSDATVDTIVQALNRGNGTTLGYTILGKVSVNSTDQPSTSSTPSPTATVTGASTTKKFQARMTVNETYKAGFNDSSSTDFKIFAYNFSRSVGGFLNTELDGFERVVVKGLANGSVVVDFDIVVQKSSDATVDTIVQALNRGNGTTLGYTILGKVSVNSTDQPSTSSTPSPTATVTGASTTKKFQARMTVNETYKAGFNDSSSTDFKIFAYNFSRSVGGFLNTELDGFERVVVKGLANGSVVVDFDIVVQKSSDATVDTIVQALNRGNGTTLGYTILGKVSVNSTDQPSTSSTPSPTATVTETPSTTPVATEIWDKAIDLATPLGTFIIVVVAVALILILIIALICVCCKYAKLKKKTRFPEHMMINDSGWTRSSDDLLMWERNLRASEVKPTNGVLSRPVNDKRT